MIVIHLDSDLEVFSWFAKSSALASTITMFKNLVQDGSGDQQIFVEGKECFFKQSEHCWLLGVVEKILPKNQFEVSSLDEHTNVGRSSSLALIREVFCLCVCNIR